MINYQWKKEEVESILRGTIEDRQRCLKYERLAKTPERKAYWHGKANGLNIAIRNAKWWQADKEELEKGQVKE